MWTSTPDGTLRAYGKCMDVAWGSKADGATVQLVTCNGNAAQRFTLTSRGDLVNAQSDKCVDVADWNTTNGARLQQWSCAGTANQKWWRIT
jgi:Ricin-type beta-trefoil lectin domain